MKSSWLPTGVLMLASVVSAATPEVKVIAHSSVKVSHLSSGELKAVFLEISTSLPDGSQVAPVLLKAGGVHDAFVRHYTGKTAAGLENYYRSLVFAGKGAMPKTLASNAAMVEYVRKTRGAIGYVSIDTATDGVNVLDVK